MFLVALCVLYKLHPSDVNIETKTKAGNDSSNYLHWNTLTVIVSSFHCLNSSSCNSSANQIAALSQMSWLMKTAAIELRVTSLNRQRSHTQRLVSLLLDDQPHTQHTGTGLSTKIIIRHCLIGSQRCTHHNLLTSVYEFKTLNVYFQLMGSRAWRKRPDLSVVFCILTQFLKVCGALMYKSDNWLDVCISLDLKLFFRRVIPDCFFYWNSYVTLSVCHQCGGSCWVC